MFQVVAGFAAPKCDSSHIEPLTGKGISCQFALRDNVPPLDYFGVNIWIKKQATKEILQCVQIRFISGHKIIECMHNVQVVNELVKNYFGAEMVKTR